MRKTLVITDVTEMRGDEVCVAGIDEVGFCIRPVLREGVKGGVKVYQRGGAKLYQWTRQHDWERCRGLLKLGPSLSPDLNSSCCYA